MPTKPIITRRRALGLAAGAAGSLTIAVPKLHAAEKKEAFALVGDRYHNSDYIRTALNRTLVREAGIDIEFSDETDRLNAGTLAGRRLLIVFRDGMKWPGGYMGDYPGYNAATGPEMRSVPPLPGMDADPVYWITPEQGEAVRDFVLRGGSAWFFHNASNISLGDGAFRDVEGAIYTGHPPVRAFWVRMTNRNHPITRGVNDFLVVDEQHYVVYDKSPEDVFMRSENADGLSYGDQGTGCEAGWAYGYGDGRVCFTAPGHMISAMWNPGYVKLQHNAARWLMREV